MASTEPSKCYLILIPIELQQMIVHNLTLFDKHHLRLTARHFQYLTAPTPLEKIRDAARRRSSRMCSTCLEVRNLRHFPQRYHVRHLRGDPQPRKRRAASIPKVQGAMFIHKLRHRKGMTCDGRSRKFFAVCTDCGTGRKASGKAPVWPLGTWTRMWRHEHFKVYCADCREMRTIEDDRQLLRLNDVERKKHCWGCWLEENPELKAAEEARLEELQALMDEEGELHEMMDEEYRLFKLHNM